MVRRGRHGSGTVRKVLSNFRILVITEDSGGAMVYLRTRLRNAGSLRVLVRPGASPDAKNLLKEARSNLRSRDDADFVILVFDRDHRRKIFQETISACRASDELMSICSAPSIEYWFLLHFVDLAPAIESPAQMIALLKREPAFEGYSKGSFDVSAALMAGDEAAAIGRSKRQRTAIERAGGVVPWTEVDILLSDLDHLALLSGGHRAKLLARKRENGK